MRVMHSNLQRRICRSVSLYYVYIICIYYIYIYITYRHIYVLCIFSFLIYIFFKTTACCFGLRSLPFVVFLLRRRRVMSSGRVVESLSESDTVRSLSSAWQRRPQRTRAKAAPRASCCLGRNPTRTTMTRP